MPIIKFTCRREIVFQIKLKTTTPQVWKCHDPGPHNIPPQTEPKNHDPSALPHAIAQNRSFAFNPFNVQHNLLRHLLHYHLYCCLVISFWLNCSRWNLFLLPELKGEVNNFYTVLRHNWLPRLWFLNRWTFSINNIGKISGTYFCLTKLKHK